MTELILRLFVKDWRNAQTPAVRLRYGRVAGILGIVTNLLLFFLKLVAGILSGSISVIADSVNNLTDGASSVITLVGFKLSGKPADEHHPYGHARYEYVSGLAVSLLVVVIGLEFLKSSVEKILNPEPVFFSSLTAIILAGSILLKLWQGAFYKKAGARINSAALLAAATDSRNDVITTAAVLAGGVLAHYSGLLLDGWMGLMVAIFILVSGAGLLKEILTPLLGAAPDHKLVAELEALILSYPSVIGVHDMMIHAYGEGIIFATVHVEVPADQDILVSHEIIDRIELKTAREMNVRLVVHLDPVVESEALLALRVCVDRALAAIHPELTGHDLRLRAYRGRERLLFEVTAPPGFSLTDDRLRALIHERLRDGGCPHDCVITIDRSYTSTTGETGG
ncbi:MAG: cation diffusion facilitator family transporter [Oscillospiraceae bacterium]|jgi:cation diffusion facilitator family transporter|nr:cation diffusion facilitator family transporter [Oscillospiraceae bacterium]